MTATQVARGAVVTIGKNDAHVAPGAKGVLLGWHPDTGYPLVLVAGRRVALLPGQIAPDGKSRNPAPCSKETERASEVPPVKASPEVMRQRRERTVAAAKALPVQALPELATAIGQAAAPRGSDTRHVKSVCIVAGCDETARARGLCSTHYARWRYHRAHTSTGGPSMTTEQAVSAERTRTDNGRHLDKDDPVQEAAALLRKRLASAALTGKPCPELERLVAAIRLLDAEPSR